MNNSTYIIARLQTLAEIDEAREAGVNAVSIDCYNTPDICNASSKQYERLKELELSHADITALKAKCDEAKIDLIGTPHSYKDAVFLAKLGCAKLAIEPQYLTITAMLNSIANLGKPIILRLGATDWPQIGKAFYAVHCGHFVTLLHTVCSPAVNLPDQYNLSLIPEIAKIYQKCLIGFADLNMDAMTAVLAYGMGARIYELPATKVNYTADKLGYIVEILRQAEEKVGSNIRKIQPSEEAWRLMMLDRE